MAAERGEAWRSGIGLRTPHYRAFLEAQPPVGFVEVHSENFFGRGDRPLGGQAAALLQRVRDAYALSLHGIGLSLGSAEAPRELHLLQLRQLVQRYQPDWVSDHLSWVGIGGIYLNDLLPLPYTEESLAAVGANIDRVQNAIGRRLLIENPSRYLDFTHSTIPEPEFMNALADASGCGILLDVNNIYVSATNLGFDAGEYLAAVAPQHVEEIHLAGYSVDEQLLLDTHSAPVTQPVWDLYRQALRHLGDRATLIEWDADLPPLDGLLAEAAKADGHRAAVGEGSHADT